MHVCSRRVGHAAWRNAAELVLTAEEVARLNEAFPPGTAEGDRYPDMSTAGR